MAEQKQDGRVGVPKHGFLGHNRGALEVGGGGVARFGVEDVVVERAVLLKAALIEAARHKGAVARLDGGEHVVLRAVGVLHAHVPGVAVKALAHHVDVAAQADGSISDAALLKERHEVVGDVAFGNAA